MSNVALQIPKHAFTKNPSRAARPLTVVQTPAPLSDMVESTAVHSIAVLIPLAACASFFVAAWIGFAADREAAVSVFMAGFINVVLMGLLAGCGWYSRNMDNSTGRTFSAFIRGTVDTATGQITGRDALIQIAAMPVIVSIGGMIIIACAVFSGGGG